MLDFDRAPVKKDFKDNFEIILSFLNKNML